MTSLNYMNRKRIAQHNSYDIQKKQVKNSGNFLLHLRNSLMQIDLCCLITFLRSTVQYFKTMREMT